MRAPLESAWNGLGNFYIWSEHSPSGRVGSSNSGGNAALQTLFRVLEEAVMDGIIYLVGLVVILMAILSFLGFR